MPIYGDAASYASQKKECVKREGALEWPCLVCKSPGGGRPMTHDGCHADWGQKGCSCGCQCPAINGQLLDELMNYNLCGG